MGAVAYAEKVSGQIELCTVCNGGWVDWFLPGLQERGVGACPKCFQTFQAIEQPDPQKVAT